MCIFSHHKVKQVHEIENFEDGLIGYRKMRVFYNGKRTLLKSPVQYINWGGARSQNPLTHEIPKDQAAKLSRSQGNCGIYAYRLLRDLGSLSRYLRSHLRVKIVMWGTVVEHRGYHGNPGGYRAQKAKIIEIENLDSRFASQLASAFPDVKIVEKLT